MCLNKLLCELEIKKGDVLDVSSDLRKIILYCREHGEIFDPNELIDELKALVGTEGTLLIRTWNWEFCHGIPFDYVKTPSQVGALGNVALKRSDFKRTEHAIYSFAVWGKYQNELVRMKNVSAWGEDSPFAFMTEHHAKQLMLGSDMYNSLTYVHYVEEQVGVSYRYIKNFTGKYKTADGMEEERTYAMNVRDLDLDIQMFNEETAKYFPETFEEIFGRNGILKKIQKKNLFLGTVDLAKAFNIIKDDIINNKSRKICLYKGQ